MSALQLQLEESTGLKFNYRLAFIGLSVVAGAMAVFPLSYVSSSNFIIAALLFPFAFFTRGNPRVNYLHAGLLIAFGILSFRYQLKIFYFFALCFYVLFSVELFAGKVNALILFLVAVMSPIFQQVSIILGFPIRIQLSSSAGKILQLIGLKVIVTGNVICLNSFSFSVDDACMGLNMLAISMLAGVFILIYYFRIYKKQLSFFYLSVFFVAVFILNIASNLLRILVLVVFQVLPENPLHELIGVAGMVMYVMIPLYFLARILMNARAVVFTASEGSQPTNIYKTPTACALGIAVVVLGINIKPKRAEADVPHAFVRYENVKAIQMEGGITKLFDGDLLIYIKTIPEFFTGEHTPLICWRGSGYVFNGVHETTVAGRPIYVGQLVKGNELLYTAWWYTNGEKQTISQWEWRTSMIKEHKSFYLVNVTSADEEILLKEIGSIFKNNSLEINRQSVATPDELGSCK